MHEWGSGSAPFQARMLILNSCSFRLEQAVPTLQSLGSGATFAEISKSELEGFEIALPPPSEQKRIAAILNEQMEAVKPARAGAEAQLEAAKALPRRLPSAPSSPAPSSNNGR